MTISTTKTTTTKTSPVNATIARMNFLFIDGFHKNPWMMAKIEAYLAKTVLQHNKDDRPIMTYDHILCSIPVSIENAPNGQQERQFNPKAVPKVQQALASGQYHGVVVVDWTDFEQEFVTHLGRSMSQFCHAGGILAFPMSQPTVVPHLVDMFDSISWKRSDYLPTPKMRWVQCHKENSLAISNSFGDYYDDSSSSMENKVVTLPTIIPKLPNSFSVQSTCLKQVPLHERIYGLEEPSSQGSQYSDGGPLTAVAVHHHGTNGGRVLFMGDVRWEVLTRFLLASCPTRPIDTLARLGESTFRTIEEYKQQGNAAFLKKDYPPAAQAYQRAIHLFNKQAGAYPTQQQVHVTLYSNLAECYLRRKDYESCIKAITRGLVYTKSWACNDTSSTCNNSNNTDNDTNSSNDHNPDENNNSNNNVVKLKHQQATIIIKATLRLVKARIALVEQPLGVPNPVKVLELGQDELERLTTGAQRMIQHLATQQEKKALYDMIERVQQLLEKLTKKQKDHFRMNFAAALNTTTASGAKDNGAEEISGWM